MKAKLVKESIDWYLPYHYNEKGSVYPLNEYYEHASPEAIDVYKTYLEPIAEEIALVIYKRIKRGDWGINEVISEPGEKYQYGDYASVEAWNEMDDIYQTMIPEVQLTSEASVELSDVVLNDLEEKGLIRLEW
jgi:hypothetical protein